MNRLATGETLKEFLRRHRIGEDQMLLHRRISDAFESARFEVASVERFWFHDTWHVKLRQKHLFPLDFDNGLGIQLRSILKGLGIPSSRKDVQISTERRLIHVVFAWSRGAEGAFRPCPPQSVG